jgi:hypothetical protein
MTGKGGHEYGIPAGWNKFTHGKPVGNATRGSGLLPDLSLNGSEYCNLEKQVPATGTCLINQYLCLVRPTNHMGIRNPISDLSSIKMKSITSRVRDMYDHANDPISQNPSPQNQLVNASPTNLSHRLHLRFPARSSLSRLGVITDSAHSSAILLSVRISVICFIEHLTYPADSNLLCGSLNHR